VFVYDKLIAQLSVLAPSNKQGYRIRPNGVCAGRFCYLPRAMLGSRIVVVRDPLKRDADIVPTSTVDPDSPALVVQSSPVPRIMRR
jgi:hypothetical protein